MPYYVAGIDRETREQTLFQEFKTYKKAVDCFVKNMPNYDDDDIILAQARSKEEFAENWPSFMSLKYFQEQMYKKYVSPGYMLPGKE